MSERGTEAALGALARLYRDLERELEALGPACALSGRCCDFPRSGLTLFATELEVEWLGRRRPRGKNPDLERCPHDEGGLCAAREGRPLGCRLYFCDRTKESELADLSARYHSRLKELHEAAGVSYRYAPFLALVRERPPASR